MAHRYIFLENIAGRGAGRTRRRPHGLSPQSGPLDRIPFRHADPFAPRGSRTLDRFVEKLARRMRTSVEDYSLTDTAGWHAAHAREQDRKSVV